MKNQIDLETLYQIIENLQVIKAPIAIKGGLLLNASLQEHMSCISRMTRDIDGNWLHKQPNIQEMKDILEQAVQMSYPDYTVRIKRNYNTRQSAGFEILNQCQEIVTKFDIDVNKPTTTTPYMINNTSFQGVTIEQMLCDKISVLSSPRIMRRTKDLLDVYAITQTIPYNKESLVNLLVQRDLGDFSSLYERKTDIQYAYNKLMDITNKPEFEDVYTTVCNYCKDIAIDITNVKATHHHDRAADLAQYETLFQENQQQDEHEFS